MLWVGEGGGGGMDLVLCEPLVCVCGGGVVLVICEPIVYVKIYQYLPSKWNSRRNVCI